MQRELADAHEQVLAAADHLVHGLAAEVGGRELRHAQLEAGERLPGEGGVQVVCRQPDRVALGHVGKLPDQSGSVCSCRRSRIRFLREL